MRYTMLELSPRDAWENRHRFASLKACVKAQSDFRLKHRFESPRLDDKFAGVIKIYFNITDNDIHEIRCELIRDKRMCGIIAKVEKNTNKNELHKVNDIASVLRFTSYSVLHEINLQASTTSPASRHNLAGKSLIYCFKTFCQPKAICWSYRHESQRGLLCLSPKLECSVIL